jgi:hypothetical protein
MFDNWQKGAPPRVCAHLGRGYPANWVGGDVEYSKLYTMSESGARDGGGISSRSTQKRVFHTDAEIVPGPVCFVDL